MSTQSTASQSTASQSTASHAAIDEITHLRERSFRQRMLTSQSFWVTVAVLTIIAVMTLYQPTAFASADNFFNITRNFAFIGIMALGMTAVILTGGIDLSVGSIMGLVGVVCGLLLQAGQHWAVAIAAGLLAGAATGAVNGVLIAYVGLPSFVVTLGMLSIARSLAIVLSQNKIIYQLGPSGDFFEAIGGGDILGIANPVWLLLIMALVFGYVFNFMAWGRYLFAIGGNENAARLTGVPVKRIKLEAYIVSVMIVGWQGSAINALGTGYELRVIASTVIGGASLIGGEGGAFGAVMGAALIEVIRNSLLMAGVDSNWQGTFVGLFIILAVLLQRIRQRPAE
jgi:ribose transport system permease protein